MDIYLFTIFSILLYGFIDTKVNSESKWSVWRLLILIILACIAGLRYKVGTDYGGYASNFYIYANEPINIGFSDLLKEPGIRILAKIVGFVYFDYAVFIFLCSLLTVGLYVITISKVSDNFLISILLFILIGSWSVSFNAVRQCLAASIIFAGHSYIYNKKFFKWGLVVFTAMLFHVSALFCLLFFFIPARKLKTFELLIIIVISIFSSFLFEYFFSIQEMLTNKKINEVGMIYATRTVNFLRVIVAWIPVFLYIFLVRKKSTYDNKFLFYINFTIVNAVISSIMKDSALFFRMGIYSQIFLVISWPMLISYFPKTKRQFFTIVLLITYSIWFFYELGDDIHYNWIFSRPNSVYQ